MIKSKPEVYLAFTPKMLQTNPNALSDLISVLLLANHDIRITSDGYCTIVEAVGRGFGKSFQLMDDEQDEVIVPSKYVDWVKKEADEEVAFARGDKYD